jgi:hypothetical protein
MTLTHGGEGGTTMISSVTIDSPADFVDASGWRYYRIRATGTNILPGSAAAGSERQDSALRKYSLRRDRFTGQAVTQPRVTRTVEAIVRPKSPFNVAVLARDTIIFTNHNVVIDSYDSEDPNKSVLGQWNLNKRQKNGDVATNGTLISAGEAHVYGDMFTNGGQVTGISNVTGQIRDDFYQDLPYVPEPEWTSYALAPPPSSGVTVLQSSTVQGVRKYQIPSLSLNGGEVLQIKGEPDRITYVDVWVTGNVKVAGQGQIMVDKNVIVSLYAAGDVDIQGNGITNGDLSTDSRPGHFLLYGIRPADGSTKSLTLGGNANMEASVYAPDSAVEINGGGNSGAFHGAVVGKTVFMNGVTTVHYDEALTRSGIVTDYRIVSWVEDTR